MSDEEGPKRKASEHFRQVHRELANTPLAVTPPTGTDLDESLDLSRRQRIRIWNELLEVERDATDPLVKKLAGVVRQLLGRSHGP